MTTLIDGLTDTLDHILSAEAIEPELDGKGNVKPIKWKMTLDQANSGVVASATVNGRIYDVYADSFKVAVTKIKDVPRTPEELMKTSPTVRLQDTQTPGFMDKSIAAVASESLTTTVTKPRKATAEEEKEAETYTKAKNK